MWQLESADMLVAYRCICDGARGAHKYVQITHTNEFVSSYTTYANATRSRHAICRGR